MDRLVEVKGIEPCVLLPLFIEKGVFIMSCCVLNFSRYFSSHSSILLTIFTVILLNISSSDLDLVVSGERGLSFHVDILSAILSILSATWFIALFFSWIDIFPSTWQELPPQGFYIVSI